MTLDDKIKQTHRRALSNGIHK